MHRSTQTLHLASTALAMSAVATGAALLAASAVASAQSAADNGGAKATPPVVVIVKVPKPWYAPRALVLGKMRGTLSEYARLPGLAFKAFSFERASGDYGGLYYWRDRTAAQAWFDPAWFKRVRKERGHEPQVRYFDAPVSIDNVQGGMAANADSGSVATLVEIPIPAGMTREQLDAAFVAAVPTYQKVPGLLRKHFTVSDSGSFGGVYLWQDEAHARAWFNEAWHDRVRKSYGHDARIEFYDTPILLPTQRADNNVRSSALVVAAP